jgi:Zn-dependent metalloprotease
MKQHYWLTLATTILLNITTAYSQGAAPPTPAGPKPFLLQLGGKNQQLGGQQAPALLKERLGLGDRDQMTPIGPPVTESGKTFQQFQQYHGGIKVEHGVYRLHARQGVPDLITGELYRVPAGLSLRPSLSERQALGRALSYVGAQTYQWEVAAEAQQRQKQRSDFRASYYPQGELVLCGVYQRDGAQVSDGGIALAYKFDVYAAKPLSRAYIYVNAHTGAIIHQNAILKHVDGTGHTRYSGSRPLSTTAANGSYRLRDASRGGGVEVYNLRGGTYPGSAIDFTDNDNQWTAAEHDNALMDDAALDAHWGAALTYDYFRNVHGRNSIDGNGKKLECYVHYGQGVINAFWDGTSVYLGDGGHYNGQMVQPLSTLDITAHEIGHGLCQYTADLVYRNESGALNEGFSDIWGAAIENYANAGKAIWTMGEDADFTIRSFSDPNQFDQPDTYLGEHWYTGSGDNGGVHYNSGVLNHWFYLLSVGKTGVNDNGENYAVTGIGIEKAARIAYRTESVYLTANSQYVDACVYSMQAAADLYGANSPEALQTANAWRAVGVYQYASAPSGLTATAASATQVNLSWRDNATGETGYQIERSASATEGFTLVGTAAANATTYQQRDLTTNAIYYYRVRAITDASTYTGYSNVAAVTLGTPPVIMSSTSQSLCNAIFLDPGGTGNYPNYQYVTMRLSPATPGSKLRVTFTAFDTEAGSDVLRIYDGNSTYDPLIGTYSGNSLPPSITATNAGGHLTFQLYTDGSITGAGWQATLTCVTLPGAPTNLTATAASTTQINLSWADNASDETGFSIERSTAAGGPFTSVATVAANALTYQDRGLPTDARYHYRVRAYRSEVYSAYSNEASAVLGTPPLIMSNTVVTTCNAALLDPGGQGEYRNYEYVTMTLAPATAGDKVRLNFTFFDTESGSDVLRIYDGNSIYDPLIGTYSGTTLPPVITAAQTSGRLTLQFVSDYSGTRAGWRATVSCVTPPAAPTGLAATAASATAVALQWTDIASDETGFVIERSLVPGTGFTEITR